MKKLIPLFAFAIFYFQSTSELAAQATGYSGTYIGSRGSILEIEGDHYTLRRVYGMLGEMYSGYSSGRITSIDENLLSLTSDRAKNDSDKVNEC